MNPIDAIERWHAVDEFIKSLVIPFPVVMRDELRDRAAGYCQVEMVAGRVGS